MMRKLMLLYLFLTALRSHAQTNFTKVYYPFIYKAESAILKDNYTDALKLYQAAFQNVEKPFSRDYLNAAVCASKSGEFSLSFRFCDSLIAKGVKKGFLNNFGGLAALRNSQGWKEYIAQYENKFTQLRKGRDTSLASVFRDLHRLDQEFRTKPGSY